MKRILALILGLGLGIGLIGVLPLSADEDKDEREKYPFYPSLLNTTSGKPVKSGEFESPEVCRECHAEIYDQWKGSMHSNAWNDPVFQALWRLGNKETGGLTEKLCAGCHTAIGTISEEILQKDEKGDYKISEIAKHGVQCDVCHSVKAATYKDAKGLEPHNATLLIDPGDVKYGPFKDAKSPHHETSYSELHTKAEFCANCHHVFHPLSGFPIERTYDEWKNSVYQQNGIVCQDCHMATVEDAMEVARTLKKVLRPGKAANEGPERSHIYSHYFVGGNVTIPALLGYNKHADMAKKRLQSAAKVEIIAPAEMKTGQLGTVKVKITNVGAGHNLPTSLTEVRQMWLEVLICDKDGNKILHTGWLDKDHNIEPEATIYNTPGVDKDGHQTVKPWEVARFEYDNTIRPKGSATEVYSFVVPSTQKGPIQIKATLCYRSYPQAVANLLLGKDAPVLPIVDMAAASGSIKVN
ncbi:MAG: hypothetical protein HZA78_05495 [Candidatus Schekmanbacteria bacterium]|nr:hypothetical protein [Candidatus Schekmanbacteria bacterium]